MSEADSQYYLPIERFRQIEGPVIDLRTPKEYEQGHLKGAINIPLFSNAEREIIGKTYKKVGRDKAIIIGLKLTGPKVEGLKAIFENLVANNNHITDSKRKGLLRVYCWRGGMRSASIGWLLKVIGLNPLILRGGYKAYRKWVLSQFEEEWSLKQIGGKTGTGKTDLLLALALKGIRVIDLEGLANHRGSSFGGLGLEPQPTSEHYENLIAEELNSFPIKKPKAIWIEAESSNLGRCRIPTSFFKQMKKAPIVEIERSKNERIKKLVEVYSCQDKAKLEEATKRISKRLGPQRTTKAIEAIIQEKWGLACEAMLDYYDRCYEYELKKASKETTLDLTGLSSDQAANKLIYEGIVY